MESQRLFLVIALVVVGLLLYSNWENDRLKLLQKEKNKNELNIPGSNNSSKSPVLPSTTTKEPNNTGVPKISDVPEQAPAIIKTKSANTQSKNSQRITVKTDVLNVVIDTIGADIRQVELLKYSKSVGDQNPFRLMTDSGQKYYIESGFTESENFKLPNHNSVYSTIQNNYDLGDQSELKVNFSWKDENGVSVTKTYIFKRGKYDIEVIYTLNNTTAKAWKAATYWQLVRQYNQNSQHSIFLPTFTGAAIYTKEENYEKISFDEIRNNELASRVELKRQVGGWVAMLEHYFVAAWLPAKKDESRFYSQYESNSGLHKIGLHSYKVAVINPGEKAEFTKKLYVGPKIEKNLEPLSKGFELTIDFGWLTFISKPLFWILDWIHGWIGNWGWAIIILTILIKLLFYKLSETSYRSMAKMKELHPRLQALRERYGDNKQAQHEAMMKMYREEKINPLGGCLPILVQIPVFIALYYMLMESVELRQAPFMLWIKDLSIPDPFFILPLIMGATMLLQHKLNPAPTDPVHQKVMLALPIVFTVFFFFFPAGLVLYWCVNNILSIAQQWVITKRVSGGKPIFQRSD